MPTSTSVIFVIVLAFLISIINDIRDKDRRCLCLLVLLAVAAAIQG